MTINFYALGSSEQTSMSIERREIVDAVTPMPQSFARATGASKGTVSIQALKASIRENFPPPPPAPALPPTHALHDITSLLDLQLAILKARAQRSRIRPSSSGLADASNRDFLASGGHLLNLSPLNKMIYVQSRRVVVAQAGATLERLDSFLRDRNLVLPVNFARTSNSQTVGAAFVTGEMSAAGTSDGLLGDIAVEVSIIDAFGRLRVFSKLSHPKIFSAIRLSLGLFGVVYDVTLRVTQGPSVVTVVHSFARLGTLLSRRGASFRRVAATHAMAQLIWYPFNAFTPDIPWTPQIDHVWLHAIDHTPEKKTVDKSAPPLLRILTLPQWLTVNSQRLFEAGYGCFESAHAPHFVADAFRQSTWILSSKRRHCHISDAVNYRYSDGVSATLAISIAIPVQVHRRASVKNPHDSPTGVANLVSEKETDYSADCNKKTDLTQEIESHSLGEYEDLNNQTGGSDDEDDNAILALCRRAIDEDGWIGVHASLEAAASCIQRMATKGPNAVATTRVYINILRRSEALLSPTNTERFADATAIITLEGAMRVPEWDTLARNILRFWASIPNARWVWSRRSAPLLQPDIAMALRPPEEILINFARLRDEAAVDDYGMFVDDTLDAIVDGAFSKSFSTSSHVCKPDTTVCVSIDEESTDRVDSLSIINQPLKKPSSIESAWRRWQELDRLPFKYNDGQENRKTLRDDNTDDYQVHSTQEKMVSWEQEHHSESDTANENSLVLIGFQEGPTKRGNEKQIYNSKEPMKTEPFPNSNHADYSNLERLMLFHVKDGHTIDSNDNQGTNSERDDHTNNLCKLLQQVLLCMQTYTGFSCITLLFFIARAVLQQIGIW